MSGRRALPLLGDGSQTRAFTHVRDIARGIILALESDRAVNQDLNISNAEEMTILDLARRIWRLCETGSDFDWVSVPSFVYDIKRRSPDPQKARGLIGFEAEVKIDEGLNEVIAWLRKVLAAEGGGSDMSGTLAIIGLGRVGLPLALVFADKGFEVCGLDVNAPARLMSCSPGGCRSWKRAAKRFFVDRSTKAFGPPWIHPGSPPASTWCSHWGLRSTRT